MNRRQDKTDQQISCQDFAHHELKYYLKAVVTVQNACGVLEREMDYLKFYLNSSRYYDSKELL